MGKNPSKKKKSNKAAKEDHPERRAGKKEAKAGGGRVQDADWGAHASIDGAGDQAVSIEPLDAPPPPRANATLTWYEDAPPVSTEGGEQKNHHVFYLFGGEYHDGARTTAVNDLLRLDVSEGISSGGEIRWERIRCAMEPPPRCAHSAVYHDHALYVFGGEAASESGDAYHHHRDCWRFDLRTLQWSEIASKNKRCAPSPRSGHAAEVWKDCMVVFGGFFDPSSSSSSSGSSKAAPAKWFNDAYVLDLRSHQWVDRPDLQPQSSASRRLNLSSATMNAPDRRSACNSAVLGDHLVVHGGYSKLERGTKSRGGASTSTTASTATAVATAVPEFKVHTDAWRLSLPDLVERGLVRWERLLWSTSRAAVAAADGHNNTRHNPTGRCGTASASYRDRHLLVYGGVMDAEHWHHRVESVFYNDAYAFDAVGRRKWRLLRLKGGGLEAGADPWDDDDAGDEEEKNAAGVADDPTTALEPHGWGLDELRSNMFAFLDGDGNLVYENLGGADRRRVDDDDNDDDDDEEDEEKEESKEDNAVERRGQRRGLPARSTEANRPATYASCNPVISSSVMVVNPETKVPEPVLRPEPLPRINANLVVAGHVLYLYGGLLEVGDREVTLDDLWRLDLRQREKWECLFPGTMHRQVWRGNEHDDDESSLATADRSEAAAGPEIDEEGASDDDRESSGDENVSHVGGAQIRGDEVEEVSGTNPIAGESLADFYARTSQHWTALAAASLSPDDSSPTEKVLKREAFHLARECYSELGSAQKRLERLDVENDGSEGKSKSAKQRRKGRNSKRES